MSTTNNFPALPIAGGTLVRAFLGLLALVTHCLKAFARARRHRREAMALAGLDRRMLADIGISRSDLRDAFSEPFWEDPTIVLCRRVNERRQYRSALRSPRERIESGFIRPPTDRPARQAM